MATLQNITGFLERDSTSAFRSIKRALPDVNVDPILDAYKLTIEKGVPEAPFLSRDPEVSFNPLPGRYLTLLCQEYPSPTLELLGAACLVPLARFSTDSAVPAELHDLFTLARESLAPQSEPAYALALADALDCVRHLHQLPSSSVQEQILSRAEQLLTSPLRNEGLPSDRLIVLLEHAIHRYKRHTGPPL